LVRRINAKLSVLDLDLDLTRLPRVFNRLLDDIIGLRGESAGQASDNNYGLSHRRSYLAFS
jgi:hypothetical protein